MITSKELTPEVMDTNAKEAESILFDTIQRADLSVFDVARWWKVHYKDCGHKRLGRIMLKLAGILQDGGD